MSWLYELSQVYDNTIKRNSDEKPTPIYHISNNASVTVTIDENGEFVKASLIDNKSDKVTLMPCTESCSSRSSGADAYPLCDKLEYVTGTSEKHSQYFNLLKSWSDSDYGTSKVKSVCKYIEKGSLLQDLKISNIKESDISDFIRWEVYIKGDTNPELWKDEETYKSWIDFYNSDYFDEYCNNKFDKKEDIEKRVRKIDFDYIDGEKVKIANYHPAKIRNSGDKAKLISSNDTSNYTFRGRFSNDREACQISSETSQKAHSALRWLLKRQGVSIGDGLSLVSWNRAGDKLPAITDGSADFDYGIEDELEEESIVYSTSEEFARAMNNRLLGYYGNLENSKNIMIMVVKEATPGQGRASIAMYRSLERTELIQALNNWYNNLVWHHCYWKNNMFIRTVGVPSPTEIVYCAYGERVKSNLVEKTIQRLLPCILDGNKIPLDLERQCVRTASNLFIIDSQTKRDTLLGIACAVYKYNHKKEDYKLALEETRTSRDYLFGRLLAVLQQYENAALKKSGQNRETNAVRYMQQFSIHPAKTWLLLYKDKLSAYRRQLEKGLQDWFEKQIQDISALFETDDFLNDKPLSGEFLLGYHCQLQSYRKKTDEESEENMEE